MKEDKCSMCGKLLGGHLIVEGEKVCIPCVKKLGYI